MSIYWIKRQCPHKKKRSTHKGLILSKGTVHIKALGNEDTLLRTQCCRHKCFPVCPRAQHLLRTQILRPGQKMFLIWFRNILCPQQMFPSLRSPRNIMSNNVSATLYPRLPGPSEERSTHKGLIGTPVWPPFH